MATNERLTDGRSALLVKPSGEEGSNSNDAGQIIIGDIGPITQARNRNLEAASSLDPVAAAVDVNEAFWDSGLNVRQLTAELVVTSGTFLYAKIVFNVAPDSDKVTQRLLAKTMLAVSNSSSTDVQWEKIVDTKDFVRRFSKVPLQNCFVQLVGTAPIASIHLGGH